MTFQAWKMKFLNFMTFQLFDDLYEPFTAICSAQTWSIKDSSKS